MQMSLAGSRISSRTPTQERGWVDCIGTGAVSPDAADGHSRVGRGALSADGTRRGLVRDTDSRRLTSQSLLTRQEQAELARSPHWSRRRQPFLLETSRTGVFAAGDVRSGSVKRVASAVGEGAMAVQLVHEYLKEM